MLQVVATIAILAFLLYCFPLSYPFSYPKIPIYINKVCKVTIFFSTSCPPCSITAHIVLAIEKTDSNYLYNR